MPPPPSLIIFDCDGVLVDTEPATIRVMSAWLNEVGMAISEPETLRRYKGHNIDLIQADAEAAVGRPIPGFVDGYRVRMFEAFEAGIEPCPGAVETLDAAEAAGVPWCVASNGPREKMAVSLAAAGLMDRCGGLEPGDAGSRVLSAYDVGAWKPEPDLFLAAAARFGPGVAADRVVVVEDSTAGVIAAKRAGMGCIAHAQLTPAQELREAGADGVIGTMADCAAALGIA